MTTTNGITPDERVRIRHHTAHLNVASVATFVLGVPAAVETQFVIESAIDKVLVEAVPLLRQILSALNMIETARLELAETAVAESVGSINLNAKARDDLDRDYSTWQGKLCNLLGVIPNPYDKSRGVGVNVRVMHG